MKIVDCLSWLRYSWGSFQTKLDAGGQMMLWSLRFSLSLSFSFLNHWLHLQAPQGDPLEVQGSLLLIAQSTKRENSMHFSRDLTTSHSASHWHWLVHVRILADSLGHGKGGLTWPPDGRVRRYQFTTHRSLCSSLATLITGVVSFYCLVMTHPAGIKG